ncbi:MAG: hypothetical protein PWP56_2071 [Acetobacterium sp.]|nr:hypothetical protein [Acetobacterium sp.]
MIGFSDAYTGGKQLQKNEDNYAIIIQKIFEALADSEFQLVGIMSTSTQVF